MRTEHLTTTSYISADGKSFATEEACREYEGSLPRDVLFMLEHKKPQNDGLIQLYEFGYDTSSRREEYEEGGFLREGGWLTVTDHESHSLGFAYGTYSEVVAHAVKNESFWSRRNSAFIKQKPFAILSRRGYEADLCASRSLSSEPSL